MIIRTNQIDKINSDINELYKQYMERGIKNNTNNFSREDLDISTNRILNASSNNDNPESDKNK